MLTTVYIMADTEGGHKLSLNRTQTLFFLFASIFSDTFVLCEQ